MSTYEPKPIDTSQAYLSKDLEELTERLAENAHDHWARLRMQEGWTWGPTRNDASKQHPDLVPYADLADSERQYDRQAAMETLKAITVLGYEINRRN